MRTLLQVLSDDERIQVHEYTLRILAQTGVRVNTAQGRKFLKDAGAEVDENTNIVKFPRELVEESLRVTTKEFTLGARRPGWDLKMNDGDCVLVIDGEAIFVVDGKTGERRDGTFDDWLNTTRLIDALDEIGLYWAMLDSGTGDMTKPDLVRYWRNLFGSFSKHIQEALEEPGHAPLFKEVLQVVFGDRETIRQEHPISFLLCPQSPLMIEGPHTDAYLELLDWDIPVAVMPMPLMGATAPGSLISTVVLGNCDVLAMLCLIQAAAPGTPFIYAPALAIIDPHTGRYSGGAIDGGLLGAAGTIEMGRYYGLPVMGTGIGTDHHVPCIQANYERAMNGLLPVLSWPDILVGAGLLGGSMNLCFEQLIIDVELFKMFKRAHRGITTDDDLWLEDVIGKVGPAGNFLGQKSTRKGMRGGEWHISKFGVHDTFESWDAAGRPTLIDEAREKVDHILKNHQPLPLGEDAERELDRIQKQAQEGMWET